MANTKVSEMIEATEIKNADLLMIVQEGTNKKVKVEKMNTKINELTETTELKDEDLLIVEQEGTNKNGVRIDIWTHFMRGCIINYVH